MLRILHTFFFCLTLAMGLQAQDTLLPPKPRLLPRPVSNFIQGTATETVDTSGLPVRQALVKGRKVNFKRIDEAMQLAVNRLLGKGGGTLYIPAGWYYLDRGVDIVPVGERPVSVTIQGGGSVFAPTYADERSVMCIKFRAAHRPLLHEIRIEHLCFDGQYFIGSTKNFFNTRKAPPGMAVCGVAVLNARYVHIAHCRFNELYGQGIYIFNQDDKRQTDTNARASYVEVYDNRIMNCWGQQFYTTPNGNFDHYGDGILLSSVARGAVFDNVVYNNLYQTGYYGRLGIGTDFQSGHVQIIRNRVHGYDRNIHLEYSRGGFLVAYNSISGSEVGIWIQALNSHLAYQRPIRIEGNTISNRGIPPGFSSPRNFSKYSGLINFYDHADIHRGSVVKNNTVVFDAGEGYTLMSDRNPSGKVFMVICRQREVQFSGNRFTVLRNEAGRYRSALDLAEPGMWKQNTLRGLDELGQVKPQSGQNRVSR